MSSEKVKCERPSSLDQPQSTSPNEEAQKLLSPISEQAPSPHTVEKAEEEKLKAKFKLPANWQGRGGHSMFLQKRLAGRGQKYFDSGDYQMAKQQQKKQQQQPLAGAGAGASTGSVSVEVEEEEGEKFGAIPTPDTVPTRKTSIIPTKHHQFPNQGN